MSSNFQSSFIPKDSDQNGFSKEKPGVLAMVSLVILSLTFLSAVGLMVYKRVLKNSNENLKVMLVESERNIDRNSVNQILTLDKKLKLSNNVIARHEVISNFMKDLASSTVAGVFFSDFNYGNLDNTGISVGMLGSAPSYSAIAFQESVFVRNSNYKRINFSDLRLGSDGRVTFSVSIFLDPKISEYSPNISNILENPQTTQEESVVEEVELNIET